MDRNRLSDFGDDRAKIYNFGINVVTRLCKDLMRAGCPGLHFYSMNQSKPIIDILSGIDFAIDE